MTAPERCYICNRQIYRATDTPAPNPEHSTCAPHPPGPTITISTPSAQPSASASPTAGGSYEPMEAILLQVLKILENSSALYDLNLNKDSEQLSFSFKAEIPTGQSPQG